MSKLPDSLSKGLYNPEFLPDRLDLNEFLRDDEEEREQVRKTVARKIQTPDDRPLTRRQADEARVLIDSTLEAIAERREQIAQTREKINQQIEAKGGPELQFDLDISKKRNLRRAVRKVFGVNTGTITYSMYLEALAAKKLVEKEEVDGYVAGDF